MLRVPGAGLEGSKASAVPARKRTERPGRQRASHPCTASCEHNLRRLALAARSRRERNPQDADEPRDGSVLRQKLEPHAEPLLGGSWQLAEGSQLLPVQLRQCKRVDLRPRVQPGPQVEWQLTAPHLGVGPGKSRRQPPALQVGCERRAAEQLEGQWVAEERCGGLPATEQQQQRQRTARLQAHGDGRARRKFSSAREANSRNRNQQSLTRSRSPWPLAHTPPITTVTTAASSQVQNKNRINFFVCSLSGRRDVPRLREQRVKLIQPFLERKVQV